MPILLPIPFQQALDDAWLKWRAWDTKENSISAQNTKYGYALPTAHNYGNHA